MPLLRMKCPLMKCPQQAVIDHNRFIEPISRAVLNDYQNVVAQGNWSEGALQMVDKIAEQGL